MTVKLKIKKLLRLPIYRIDILNNVDTKHYNGLCEAINDSIYDAFHKYLYLPDIFPLSTYSNALKFDAYRGGSFGYWWRPKDWKRGRRDFFNWLKEQYKNDREDLRKFL